MQEINFLEIKTNSEANFCRSHSDGGLTTAIRQYSNKEIHALQNSIQRSLFLAARRKFKAQPDRAGDLFLDF